MGEALLRAPEHAGLLERGAQLALLDDALAAVEETSRGSVLLVGGEAGVGKTSLVRAFCDDHLGSASLIWGACDPLFTPRPLGPLLAVAEEVGGDLDALVGSDAKPHEVVAALARLLRARRPSVFVLEDVHWADEATLDVVRLLARRVESIPVLVMVTYRDELDRGHPLRVVVGELATNGAVRRLMLSPLSRAAVEVLAEPHHLDADELYDKTGGNPFFVVEAIAAGAAHIPDTVRDAVLARTAQLSKGARALLDAAAVVPSRAELWLIEALGGDALGRLDECLASGILTSEQASVGFRHELARLAIEGSIAPNRKIELHRKALAALADPPNGPVDSARLAHHADAAGDADAVLRFAPLAAARAAALGAHREAAAQYARVLRFGERLSTAERAEVCEQRAFECYLTDQSEVAIAVAEEALACRRLLGQRLEEGNALRFLSYILWCPGHTADAERAACEAVELLETLPPGRELALAYANLAATYAPASRSEEAVFWARRALDLAEQLGDEEIAINALTTMGRSEGWERGGEKLEQSLARALEAGLAEQAGRTFMMLGEVVVDARAHEGAGRHLDAGIAYCSEQGLELFRIYLLAFRARFELDQGRWAEAAESAAAVIRVPRTSISPRIIALVVLALVRARRGDPGYEELLDEAWELAEPTGELLRLGGVAVARAETAWLAGRDDAVAPATERALRLAVERGSGRHAGRLATWRRRAGVVEDAPPVVAEPYSLELAGEWSRAAARWEELGCPYEAALALAEEADEESLRRALDWLQSLGARPAVARVARRLREQGARGLPRGPRPATVRNPAGLTPRELEVLSLVAEGLRNAEIASRLVLSERTVGHHVGAILRKLDVQTRMQAGVEATRRGIVAPR